MMQNGILTRALTRFGIPLMCAAILSAAPLRAQDAARPVPSEVEANLPKAELRGSAQLRWLGFRIYDARLFTSNAAAFDWSSPFALELDYKRGFSRKQLVSATGKELTRLEGDQPDQPEILQKLNTCFNTVEAGDRFVALGAAKDRVDFLFNGKRTCKLQHPNIRQRVLSIWLSDQARDPKLSRKLRGM